MAGAGVVAGRVPRPGGPAWVLVHADALVQVLERGKVVTCILAGPRAPLKFERFLTNFDLLCESFKMLLLTNLIGSCSPI